MMAKRRKKVWEFIGRLLEDASYIVLEGSEFLDQGLPLLGAETFFEFLHARAPRLAHGVTVFLERLRASLLGPPTVQEGFYLLDGLLCLQCVHQFFLVGNPAVHSQLFVFRTNRVAPT